MNDQLSSVRRTFDERLVALEAGLADPSSGPSLDALVLNLLRAVGDEAEAAAKDSALRSQRAAEAMLATAMAQAQAAHVQLDGERALIATLRSEVTALEEQLATSITARQHDQTELKANIAALQKSLDEATRAAAVNAEKLATTTARADTAVRERDELAHDLHNRAAEHDALVAERDALLDERTSLAASRDAVVAERNKIVAERDALVIERNALIVERNALLTAKETLTAERDKLERERLDFVKTHDAMVLQRDMITHERDDIVRDRDQQIKQLHADLEAREAALKEAREKAAVAKEAAPAQASPAASSPAAAKKSGAKVPPNGPLRKADRKAFTSALGVQIDGEAALLVDLSVIGAQVLSCSSLKPDKTVKMLLPSSDSPVLCRGRIVWARLEPTLPGRPIRYRAGMFFTATDQAAVQTFMSRHGQARG